MSVLLKKIGLFLQVRINSNRMPGKALLPILGKNLIVHAMERLQVVPADIRALLTNKDSAPLLKDFAESMGWEIFIGDDENVLKRYVDAALYYNVDIVIRATGDNPLVSSEIAIETLDLFNKEKTDLAYLEPIPYGSGVEVIDKNALIKVLNNTNVPYHLEHVTPYIYEHKDMFKIKSSKFHHDEVSRNDVRLSVDTREDYEKMKYLFRNIEKKGSNLKIRSIIKIWDELDFKKYKRILFATVYGGSYGMGHLKRCLLLAEKIKNDFEIYFTYRESTKNILDVINDYKINYLDFSDLDDYILNEGTFDRVVVDLRDTSIEEMKFYKTLGTVLSIDDVGDGGQLSEINIRTLPTEEDKNKLKYNFDGIEYLITDNKDKEKFAHINDPPKNVLISFGGSDTAELTRPVAEYFDSHGYNVSVITGPFFNDKIEKIGNCKIHRKIKNIEDHIKKADLIITSFGMTLMESIMLRRPAIVINPTVYHDNITIEFEYPYFISKDPDSNIPNDLVSLLDKNIDNMQKQNVFSREKNDSPLNRFYEMKIGRSLKKITDVIVNWNPSINICPYCSNLENTILHRATNWNMNECKKCGLVFLREFDDKEKKYDEKYFLEEYKQTYGKTYEEDKDNIINLAENRLKIITKRYLKSGELLDFGSALGFFAEQCEKSGFRTTSMDTSEFASQYIENVLGLRSINGDESYLEKNEDMFDVITSFYVIEHVKDFEKLIFMFNLHLRKNGIVVLSTPNLKGVTIQNKFNEYIKEHSEDHYRIYSPNFLKDLLKKYGFGNIYINITGIHPERFIRSKKLLKNKIVRNIIKIFAKIFKLGDTFEIYAQKK